MQKAGYLFRSGSDTEVVLAAFHEWGVECLHKFDGMFGFLLFDTKFNKIFVARDRFGIKPIYFSIPDQNTFVVASEIKQFTPLPFWNPKLDHQSAFEYLNWGVTDHSNSTMFSGVKQLRGGEFIYISLQELNKFNEPEKWYILSSIFKESPNRRESCHHIFGEHLEASVINHIPKNKAVEYGFCLSGGIDSSSLVSLAQQFGDSQKLKTFSFRSMSSRNDEKEYIEQMVASKHLKNREVFLDKSEVQRLLKTVIRGQDEPFNSSSVLAQWKIFEAAKNNSIKVMIDGQGADEILGGYHGYFGTFVVELLKDKQFFEATKITEQFQKSTSNSKLFFI